MTFLQKQKHLYLYFHEQKRMFCIINIFSKIFKFFNEKRFKTKFLKYFINLLEHIKDVFYQFITQLLN